MKAFGPIRTFGYVVLTLACFQVVSAVAGNFYVLPVGKGQQDGSGWENAAAQDRLQEFLSDAAQPGDRVLLGSGTYARLPHTNNTLIVVARGGTPDQPLTIAGVDTGGGRPLIEGLWKETNVRYHAHCACAIVLGEGVSHVRIGNLAITNCMQGLATRAGHSGLQIAAITVERCRDAFVLRGVSRSKFQDCHLTRYTKRGIRFEQACHDLDITGVVADATGGSNQWPTEAYPFGFSIEDGEGNHDIRFERCTARNNGFRGEPDAYWNGDGFVAEAGAESISYHRCRSFDNTDGGWDDKSRSPTFEDCIAARNKRGFRVWNVRGDDQHPARLQNCLGIYNRSAGGIGSAVGLWICGAVRAEHCTFHNNATAAVAIENNRPGASLVAENCIFSADRSVTNRVLVLKENGVTYSPTAVATWIEGIEGEDPEYLAPSSTWSGEPSDAFHSRRYGSQTGFRSDRIITKPHQPPMP